MAIVCCSSCSFPQRLCFPLFLTSDLQFTNGSFDAVVDKGGLDALMEPEVGSKLGSQYLSEVLILKSIFERRK